MSAPLHFVIDIFLCITAVTCWLGVLGMLRMREPVQALHYMTFPAALGSLTLTIAVGCRLGCRKRQRNASPSH